MIADNKKKTNTVTVLSKAISFKDRRPCNESVFDRESPILFRKFLTESVKLVFLRLVCLRRLLWVFESLVLVILLGFLIMWFVR